MSERKALLLVSAMTKNLLKEKVILELYLRAAIMTIFVIQGLIPLTADQHQSSFIFHIHCTCNVDTK